MEIDLQAFLQSEMKKAVESQDSGNELNLLLLHYHQAMLQTLQAFHLCSNCATTSLNHLLTKATQVQGRSFASTKELIATCQSQFQNLKLLCPACRTKLQHDMLVRFFQIRTHQQ